MGNTSTPLLSIIVSTRFGLHLSSCLESLQKYTTAKNQVIVVVDAKEENSQFSHLKQRFPFFEFTLSPGGGVSRARNLGLTYAKGENFLIIDDDCIVDSSELLSNIVAISKDSMLVHGGSYILKGQVGYWARIYNIVNHLWLKSGRSHRGQVHLLGGFMFGSKILLPWIHFSVSSHWGGEEKEMLRRLEEMTPYSGSWHSDLVITHLDNSDFSVFFRRALHQGIAAGKMDLVSASPAKFTEIPPKYFPGLILFFVISRIGVLYGKICKWIL